MSIPLTGDRITSGTRTHAMGEYAQRQVDARIGAGQGEIEDGVALTIASWYQSPGTWGRGMAELASTGSVVLTDLLDDIHHERQTTAKGDASQERALDMLATWALNHPSRG